MRRTPPPTACATPSQAVTSTWARTLKIRKIGPGPVRTARGAGRLVPFAAARFFGAGLRLEVVPDDRVREVELPFPPLERLREGVLLLRDAGGEDVRVAMIGIYPVDHFCPTRHTRNTVADVSDGS